MFSKRKKDKEKYNMGSTNIITIFVVKFHTPTDSVVCENTSGDEKNITQDDTFDTQVYGENEKIFDTVERPRARYDVEVVAKLVVYAG